MNAEGYRTSVGGEWKPATLADVLDHPAICGCEEDEEGNLVPTGGAAIIPVEEFLELRRIRQENRPSKERTPQREYLLTGGLAVCGLCDTPESASPPSSGSRGYRCAPSSRQHPGGCGRTRIMADLLEPYVVEHALAELSKPAVQAAIEDAREEVREEVASLRVRIEEDVEQQRDLGREFARREISKEAFKEADKLLKQRIRETRSEVRFLEQAANVPLGGVDDLVRWWKHAPLASQKGLLVLMFKQVRIYQAAARGSRTVDSNRVGLIWRSWRSLESAS
jgi:hypothetical protein